MIWNRRCPVIGGNQKIINITGIKRGGRGCYDRLGCPRIVYVGTGRVENDDVQ